MNRMSGSSSTTRILASDPPLHFASCLPNRFDRLSSHTQGGQARAANLSQARGECLQKQAAGERNNYCLAKSVQPGRNNCCDGAIVQTIA